MFGMGFTEILVIAVLGLVIFGPQRIPAIARGFGKAMREMRRAAAEVRYSLDVEDVRRDLAARNADRPPGGAPPKTDPPAIKPGEPEDAEDDAPEATPDEPEDALLVDESDPFGHNRDPFADDPPEDSEDDVEEPDLERPDDLPDSDDDDAIRAALERYQTARPIPGTFAAGSPSAVSVAVIPLTPAAAEADAVRAVRVARKRFASRLFIRTFELPARIA